jgi:hypothetical protein
MSLAEGFLHGAPSYYEGTGRILQVKYKMDGGLTVEYCAGPNM